MDVWGRRTKFFNGRGVALRRLDGAARRPYQRNEEFCPAPDVWKNRELTGHELRILYDCDMRTYTAIVERCPETGLLVGYVPGFPGAHSQAATLDEMNRNLKEVITMLTEDGEPRLESEFLGIQTVTVP